MDDMPPIILPTNGKYPLETTPILLGVNIKGGMLKKVVGLKFMDHDITNE
jgi:hypothetical protein